MKYKIASRDFLKIIALISMLIDHIGKFFFSEFVFFQILGRLAFPIFAYFIAEGFYYTSNRRKYFFQILIFAFISQIPYVFLWNGLNILFTFLISIVLLFVWDLLTKSKSIQKILLIVIFSFSIILTFFLGVLNIIDYGLYGVLLPIIFYIFRNQKFLKFLIFILMTIFYVSFDLIFVKDINFSNFLQLFSLFSIFLILLYNENMKSIKIFKYLFYFFYPFHLIVLALLKTIF